MIKEGSTVRLVYTGTLDDGTVFGYAKPEAPMEFQTGMDLTIDGFEREISHLGGKPVLVALGNATYDFLMPLKDKYPAIEKLPHYSYSRISKEQYREKLLETLKPCRTRLKQRPL